MNSMVKNAILVPGSPDKDEHYDPNRPSNSDDHWSSWLRRQLILKDILANSIEPPFPFRPRYEEWKKEFERFDIGPDTILVGHSCGGGFLVKYLSEHKNLHVGKVLLVAPWLNPENLEEFDTADFFDFEIDPNFPSRTKGVDLFISRDDMQTVLKSVDILREKIHGINYLEYENKGHFCIGDLGRVEFPELLERILL
jgi:predicted alpha/beta hydrolase family esterase